jgi:hypothetical protein
MIGFGVFSLFTIGANTYFGLTTGAASGAGFWLAQNAAVIPMAIAFISLQGALTG